MCYAHEELKLGSLAHTQCFCCLFELWSVAMHSMGLTSPFINILHFRCFLPFIKPCIALLSKPGICWCWIRRKYANSLVHLGPAISIWNWHLTITQCSEKGNLGIGDIAGTKIEVFEYLTIAYPTQAFHQTKNGNKYCMYLSHTRPPNFKLHFRTNICGSHFLITYWQQEAITDSYVSRHFGFVLYNFL